MQRIPTPSETLQSLKPNNETSVHTGEKTLSLNLTNLDTRNMVLDKLTAKRCATIAKFEGISPKTLELLTDFAYQAWLDARVAPTPPKPRPAGRTLWRRDRRSFDNRKRQSST